MRSLILVAVIWQAPSLFANEFTFSPALFYNETAWESGDEDHGERSITMTAATIGFRIPTGVLFGVKYYDHTIKAKASITNDDGDTSSSDVKQVTSGLGPAIGYAPKNGGLFGVLSYLAVSPQQETETTKLHGGRAITLDVGFRANVGNLGVGPMMSYAEFTFKKRTVDGEETDLEDDYKETLLYPMGCLWFDF